MKILHSTPPSRFIKIVKKSEQGDLIKGTVFKVTANEDIYNKARTKKFYSKGQEVAKITTNDSGIAEISKFEMLENVSEFKKHNILLD